MQLRTFVFIAFLLLAGRSVHAESVSLDAIADATLYQSSGSRSNGAGGVFFAGNNSANSIRRGLIQFDIAGNIPSGAVIESVTLTLYVSGIGGSGGADGNDPNTFLTSLYAVTRDWGEGGLGAGSDAMGTGQGFETPADGTAATWTHAYYNSDAWSIAGGDFDGTASASSLVSGVIDSAFTWTSAAMIADVQAWLDDPTSSFGWIVRGDEATPQSMRSFYSREATSAALRPALQIAYTVVPEPATGLLLASAVSLCGVGWSIRRKRVMT